MKKTVKHEIKLEKSTKVILLIMALGICANAFHFINPIEDAMAEDDCSSRHYSPVYQIYEIQGTSTLTTDNLNSICD